MSRFGNCLDCAFWQRHAESDSGECRRRSPLPALHQLDAHGHGTLRVQTWWPETTDLDWCGEWELTAAPSEDKPPWEE